MILRQHFLTVFFSLVCFVPCTGAASISGTWSIIGFDSMDTDPAGGLGRVNLQYQPYQNFVDASRSGVPGYTEIYTSETKFVPSTGLAGFTPEVFRAVQQVKAQGTSYGDLKAMASVSLGARGVGVTSQGSISAGVKITSSDKIRYFFKPTASKPLPDPLVINLSLDAIFETQAPQGDPVT